MTQATTTAAAVLRVSVVSEDRRLDVAVPAGLPLVELLPGFARRLGVLDPSLAHGGYELRRADSGALDPARSAAVQGVHDGELLTLARGGLLAEPRVYDDIVEAVVDATAAQHREWTARDNSRTAVAVSVAFLALSALLLLTIGRSSPLPLVIAGAGCLVLAVTSIVLSRVGQREGGAALGLSAAAFGGIAAFLAVPAGDPWGWPFAAASLAVAVIGAVLAAATPARSAPHLVPLVLGISVGAAATVTAAFGLDPVGPYAIMLALAATVSNGAPWLALGSTRLRVVSPQSDAEVFADPVPIDGDEIARRAASGARLLLALRVGLGLAVATATVLVAASGLAGAALAALAFVGMMFQSRQTYSRAGVLTIMSIGAAGLALTGLTVAVAQPELHTAMLVLLIVATTVLVAVALLSPRTRLGLGRVADVVEVFALALVLPLGVITAGLA